MAIDYHKTAMELLKELGGNDNITNVTHCATRLRFILKDESIVNKDKVAKIPGVITTVQAGGQFQVVIGNHVKDAYEHMIKMVTIDEEMCIRDSLSTSTKVSSHSKRTGPSLVQDTKKTATNLSLIHIYNNVNNNFILI